VKDDMTYAAKSAYVGQLAQSYDSDRTSEAIWAKEQEFMAARIASMSVGATVLDLPAGTGRFTGMFLSRGLKVIALDISADMLAELTRQHSGHGDKLVARTGDAENLDLADDCVDYLVSWRFFHLIPSTVVRRVLHEYRRVCTGSVIVHVFDIAPSGLMYRAKTAFKNALRPVYRAMLGRGKNPVRPWLHISSYQHTIAALRSAFDEAGFVVTEDVRLGYYGALPVHIFVLSRKSS